MQFVTYFAVVLFVIGAAHESNAQRGQQFEFGFVVLPEGDTLQGEVGVTPELVATRHVRFRRGTGEPIEVFTPQDIRAYGSDAGRLYVSRSIRPAEHRRIEDLFLRRLVEGPPHLYAFSVDQAPEEQIADPRIRAPYIRQRFALEEADGTLVPLYIHHRLDPAVDADVVTDRQYVRALHHLLAPCPELQRRIETLRFTEQAMISAVEMYAACIGARVAVVPVEAAGHRRDVLFEGGVRIAAGARSQSSEWGRDGGAGVTTTVGLYGAVRPLLLASGLSIPLEFGLSHVSVADEGAAHPFSPDDFAQPRLAISLGLRYEFDIGSVMPFVGIGASSARLMGDRPNRVLIGLRPIFFPEWESGLYLELGARSALPVQIGRLGGGVRYDTLGIGEPNPIARSDTHWRSSTVSGFLLMTF